MTEDSFETTIFALNSSGQGIGEYQGLKIFIDNALIGETVQVKLTQKKRNYGVAKLISVLKPSPHRIKPACPIASICGGCQIMHLNYAEQLRYKTRKVEDAFKRIAKQKDISIEPCHPSSDELYYRNKIQLPFFSKSGVPSLGLYKKASHEIVEVDTCYIHCPLGQRIYNTLKQLLNDSKLSVYCELTKKGFLRHLLMRSAVNKQQCLISFMTQDSSEKHLLRPLIEKLTQKHPEIVGVLINVNSARFNSIMGPKFETLWGQNFITETLGDFKFKISAPSFFQVNTHQAHWLYQKALEFADLQPSDTLLDAYCGIGMFSIFASKHVAKITGVEVVPFAIENAKENAKINNCSSLEFICAPLEKIIVSLPSTSCVLLNPPRKGCDGQVISALIKQKPRKIVYVSCDPATLARDCQLLMNSGYKLEKVQPLDMFPQTSHVETVVLLTQI